MAGVIDRHGQQWEHCHLCGNFIRIQKLWYEQPTAEYTCGRDLCKRCSTWVAKHLKRKVSPPGPLVTVAIP